MCNTIDFCCFYQNRTTEKLSRQLLFYNEFIHPLRENDVTLLEVASGSLDHLNLKQVVCTVLALMLTVLIFGARPQDYKTFFMLNSAEHEIFSANKYEDANNGWHFHIY